MSLYANEEDKYIVGLDLGQQNDYTVLSILKVNFDQGQRLRYELVLLLKFALRTSYIAIVDEVIRILTEKNLILDCTLVVDYTGVGHPVFDYFRIKGMRPLGVSITGGLTVNARDDSTVTVPKKDIVTYLQLVIQSKRLLIPSNLTLLNDMRQEFMNFRFKLSPTSQGVFAAKGSGHDDIVLSIGIAVWTGEYHSRKQLKAISGR